MPLLCHLWPGITPWSIWDLTLEEWRGFRSVADQWTSKK